MSSSSRGHHCDEERKDDSRVFRDVGHTEASCIAWGQGDNCWDECVLR